MDHDGGGGRSRVKKRSQWAALRERNYCKRDTESRESNVERARKDYTYAARVSTNVRARVYKIHRWFDILLFHSYIELQLLFKSISDWHKERKKTVNKSRLNVT